MTAGILGAIGGLGLFLLGMVIMTEGLRALAGESIQRLLRRFTRSPASGAATGTLVTALIQSSSATTVTAVGFAGAGLLTFPEALGIVFGANIGTTITGWLVAIFGFKLELGLGMPVLVFVGVLLKLFGRGRWANAGYSLAGFGLLFLGISALRSGMSGLEGWVTPEIFPPPDVLGRLQLVGLGVLITLVTQSSSAGVATALVAVSSGVLGWGQAAAMVIGMDVGTTVTAALATVGASLPARRTGWAHVMYNLMSASIAFAMLPLFELALESTSPGITQRQPEIALVAFHTSFESLGVLVALSITGPFSRFIERLVPERPGPFTQRLDRSLLAEPEVALRSVAPTLAELANKAGEILRAMLIDPRTVVPDSREIGLISLAVADVEHYLGAMAPAAPDSSSESRYIAALHIVDQLHRLLHREGQSPRVRALRHEPDLRAAAEKLAMALAVEGAGEATDPHEAALDSVCDVLREGRSAYRDEVARQCTLGEIAASAAIERMDAYRWLERVAHHAWRMAHHLGELQREVPSRAVAEPPEPE